MFNFLKMGNRGQVHELPSFIIAVGVFTLVLALVGLILGEFADIADTGSVAENISETGAEGMLTGAGFIPLLIIIGVVVVVLAMVMRLRGM